MEFFELFGDILLFPLNSGIGLEDDPLVLSCCCILIGMAVVGITRRCLYGFIR